MSSSYPAEYSAQQYPTTHEIPMKVKILWHSAYQNYNSTTKKKNSRKSDCFNVSFVGMYMYYQLIYVVKYYVGISFFWGGGWKSFAVN